RTAATARTLLPATNHAFGQPAPRDDAACSCAVPLFLVTATAPTALYTLFPTRRSSDLASPPRPRRAQLTDDVAEPAGREATSSRSEEHTSELQSRENLVCRLLLEKKKDVVGVAGDE